MTEKRKCKDADECDWYVAEDCSGPWNIAPVCFVEPEPPPMMICPIADECDVSDDCPSAKKHKYRRSSCPKSNKNCPACIPVLACDLDAIEWRARRRRLTAGPDWEHVTITKMRDEIEQLRAQRDASRLVVVFAEEQLELAEGRATRINQQLGVVIEERDAARAAGNVMEKQRDELRDELSLAEGRHEWTREMYNSAVDILRDCQAERNELRRELDTTTRANAQLGGLVREAQAGSVMVSGDDRDMHCSGWSQCTALHCKLISAHKIGSHVNCGLSHYCVSFEEDVWCVEVVDREVAE